MNTCCEKCRSGYTQSPLLDLCASCPCHTKGEKFLKIDKDYMKDATFEVKVLPAPHVDCCSECLKLPWKDNYCACGHHSSTPANSSWEARFDNGVALKIGNAGKSEGIVNVRKEIKSFIRAEIQSAEERGRVKGLDVPLDLRNKEILRKEGRLSVLEEIGREVNKIKRMYGNDSIARINIKDVYDILDIIRNLKSK